MIVRLMGLAPGDTIGAVLARNRGIGPGFDHLRFILATLILIGHTRWIGAAPSLGLMLTGADLAQATAIGGDGVAHWVGITKPILRTLVPAFFALSGFLVLGSALRLRSTPNFLAHRALRIFPALLVEVTLSALILGPLVTTLTPAGYFTAPEFARYFGNVVGWVSFVLPGVFEANPITRVVNMNLWTLPAEFHCYLIAAALLFARIVYNRTWFAIVFALATIALATGHFLAGISTPDGPFPAHVIVYYFFAGALFYHFKERIPVHWGLFVVALLIVYVAMMQDSLIYLAPIPLTYCMVFFGLVRLPKIKLIASGDYSYGIYLYGFPIAQSYVHFLPGLKGEIAILIVLTLTTTFLFSAFSWHVVEKRALALKALLRRNWNPHARAGSPTTRNVTVG